MAYNTVILPDRPTVDRIAAYVIFEEAVERTLDIAFGSQGVLLSDADMEALAKDGKFPIGIGKGMTYRDCEIDGKRFGSETSLILYELRNVGKLAEDMVLDDFARMMDRNNKDGYLVHQQLSINWIVRQAYRLGCDPKMVVRWCSDVVSVFLRARRIELANGLSLGLRDRAKEMANAVLMRLPESARIHNGPMSVQRYIRDMTSLEAIEDTIVSHAMLWVEIHDRARARQVAAKETADTRRFPTFQLTGRREKGVWLDSDDFYLMNELVHRCSLVVMRSSAGSIVIMSKRFRLDDMATTLMEREPDRWYYEPFQHNVLANEAPPTALSREKLEHYVGTALLTQR